MCASWFSNEVWWVAALCPMIQIPPKLTYMSFQTLRKGNPIPLGVQQPAGFQQIYSIWALTTWNMGERHTPCAHFASFLFR